MKARTTIALAGNPNSGKTTIFNNITGFRQHVGNYPGVTVEKKTGEVKYQGQWIEVIDLPGTYSLTPFSEDEIEARKFIIDERPDVVVNIVDSSNLERNLYLTVQLIELDIPMVLVLNMADIAKKTGKKINASMLSGLLGMPVVETIGSANKGTQEILRAAVEVADSRSQKRAEVKYGEEIEGEIDKIRSVLLEHELLPEDLNLRWIAIKLLEQDSNVMKLVKEASGPGYKKIGKLVLRSMVHIKKILRGTSETIIAEARYGFIKGALMEVYEEPGNGKIDITEKIDIILTNRLIGIPAFAAVIWLMFQFVFVLGKYPMGWVEAGIGKLGIALSSILPDGLIQSLLVDGIIGGVGGVIIFTPNIFLLFFAIAVLEDSGYMARAAFVMDRIMHKVGLHGKSFIPMIIGFGCTVPAYMGSRILEDRKDRLVTMHISTFSSCGARLPVYILMAGAFFPDIAGNIIFSIYVIGIIFAIIMAKVLRVTRFRGEAAPFVMELPPYRVPTFRGIMTHTWEKTRIYLKKAGTIILAASIIMWALFTFPVMGSEGLSEFEGQIEELNASFEVGQISEKELSDRSGVIEGKIAAEKMSFSAAGRIGRFLEPVFSPLGFDWKMVVASISGIAAKEVIVSTIGTIFSIEGADDEQSETLLGNLSNSYHPLVGYTFMLFTLLYFPCMASMAVFRREAGNKEMLFQMAYTLALAWVVSFIVFQIGKFFI